jgi:N-acylneuraminate cytidylyltransferase/CMP-N,N'-diacetyllegionaminic acid synthase
MIAIIPARGGSKGLPDKNIKPFCGKPMIAYTIEAALAAKGIENVFVSTDSEEIAQISKEYGAEVPFLRPDKLAQDNSKVVDAFLYTIEKLNEEFGYNINEFIKLQPTSPLRKTLHIEEAINLFYENKPDSLISYVEMSHPPVWACKITDGKVSKYFEKESEPKNRQEITKAYMPNGSIYILKYSILKTTRQYITENTIPYIMGAEVSIDIDTDFDFQVASYLFKSSMNK